MGIGVKFSGVGHPKDRMEMFSDAALKPYRAAFGKTLKIEAGFYIECSAVVVKRAKHPIIARVAFIALLPFTLLATGVGKAAMSFSDSYRTTKKQLDLNSKSMEQASREILGLTNREDADRLSNGRFWANASGTQAFSTSQTDTLADDFFPGQPYYFG